MRLKKDYLKEKKLVILVVNDFTHDSRVLKEATSALKGGYRVWVICRKSRNTKFREEKDGIKIIRVQSVLDKIWSKYNKKSTEIAGSQSIGAPKLLVTYVALLNTWLINNLITKETKKIRPDIVHANDSTTLISAYDLKNSGYKVIYDAHELYSESLEKPNLLWKKFFVYLEKKISRLDGVFSVNQSILDELDKRYKITKLPKAILYNTPKYQEIKPIRRKIIKLLYLGHNMPGRGLEELFKAIEYIPDVILSVYGNGFNKKYNSRIIINKPVPPEKVVEETKKYDIGILPYIGTNLNHMYSTPNKLFEYTMAGLALAVSDLPEIRKVVEKAQNGVLFNPRNPKDIALKIKSLMKNPQKIWQYKRNSIKFAKEYSWENQEKRQIHLYNLIIHNSELKNSDNQKPKVFVGPLDFGLNWSFKDEMKKLGFDMTTCSFVEHRSYGWKNDIELKINKVSMPKAAGRVLLNFFNSLHYNIYHFKFGQSLLPWNIDLPILKILGKKIIMNFHGLDIRQLDKFKKDKWNKVMAKTTRFNWITESKKRIRYYWIKNWVDKIVVSTPDLLEFASVAEFIPEMAPVNQQTTNNKQKTTKGSEVAKRKSCIILHAPSHRGIKGTEFVKKTIKKLQSEKYSVDLLIAENIPSEQMKEYFQKADVVVDQLLIGSYGVVTIEGMLAGKPIICYIRNDLRQYYPDKLPILSANPETLSVVLKSLIDNPDLIVKEGKNAFAYYNKYHHPRMIGQRWKKIYDKLLRSKNE